MFAVCSNNSEAFASELLEDLEEMFLPLLRKLKTSFLFRLNLSEPMSDALVENQTHFTTTAEPSATI